MNKLLYCIRVNTIATITMLGLAATLAQIPASVASPISTNLEKQNLLAPETIAYVRRIEQITFDFVESLEEDNLALARESFDSVLAKEWSLENFQQYWQEIENRTGKLKQLMTTTVNKNVVIATIEFENRTDDLFLVFNEQGKIISIDFSQD